VGSAIAWKEKPLRKLDPTKLSVCEYVAPRTVVARRTGSNAEEIMVRLKHDRGETEIVLRFRRNLVEFIEAH
jgi:hypothetical protein